MKTIVIWNTGCLEMYVFICKCAKGPYGGDSGHRFLITPCKVANNFKIVQ